MMKHKSPLLMILSLICISSFLQTIQAYDWTAEMKIASRQRDSLGNLLPLQSYDDTIRRGMSFILDDHLMWFKGSEESITDEHGKIRMPWTYYSNIQHNGAPFPNSVDRFVSYPAFHHALMGPFTSLGPRQMGTSTGFASDMDFFKDDNGKGYVIYCDHNRPEAGGKWRYAIRVDSLSDGYLKSNREGVEIFGDMNESPAMIKYKGKYITVASGVHGWAGSDTLCAVADSPLGPYKKQGYISENKTWSSQVSDLIYLKETDTVMALCDQWWIPDKADLDKSRYLFLPLFLDTETGKVTMEYRDKWAPLNPAK